MAENIEMIRPINLPEAQQLSENDVFILDSETGGVRKIPKNKVYTPVDDTLSESGKAADAKVTGEKIDELKGETALIQNPVGNKSGELVSFSDGADMPMVACTASIVPKQSGSGTPSPDNVRPISGWESVKTSVSGKNLCGISSSASTTHTSNGITWTKVDDNTIHVQGTATAQSACNLTSDWSKLAHAYLPSGTYRASTDADVNLRIGVGASNTNKGNSKGGFAVTLDTATDVWIGLFVASGTTINKDIHIQLEQGTTATDYEPYNGHTTTTSLGRTVYGGTLDVVTGVLTVDRAMVMLDENSTYAINGRIAGTSTEVKYVPSPTKASGEFNFICDRFEATSETAVGTAKGRTTSGNVFFRVPDSVETVADAQAWFGANQTQLVYELATPQTYTLTGQEVSTLLGNNNVWADSGNIEITYRKDINIVIDELTNAIVSLGSNV